MAYGSPHFYPQHYSPQSTARYEPPKKEINSKGGVFNIQLTNRSSTCIPRELSSHPGNPMKDERPLKSQTTLVMYPLQSSALGSGPGPWQSEMLRRARRVSLVEAIPKAPKHTACPQPFTHALKFLITCMTQCPTQQWGEIPSNTLDIKTDEESKCP